MKLLFDMNLSPKLVDMLIARGIEGARSSNHMDVA